MSSYDKRIKLYIFLLSLPMVAGLIIFGVFFKIKLDKLHGRNKECHPEASVYCGLKDPSNQRVAPRDSSSCPSIMRDRTKNDREDHFSVPLDLEFYEVAFKIGGKRASESPQSPLGDCGGAKKYGFSGDGNTFCSDAVSLPAPACAGRQSGARDCGAIAGIAPHHLLAADMIAEFYSNLSGLEYDTIILIGPNHFDAGDYDIAVSQYDWETPYGVLEADRKMAAELVNAIVETGHCPHCPISTNEDIFQNEHSINSHAAFIKKIFPNAKFLPVILKSSVNAEQAKNLAEKIYEISKNKKILVLASIDFSHYKDSKTAMAHDKESIAAIENFVFDKIYELDIDSPASLYTLMEYSRMRSVDFNLLRNSNSAILAGKPDLEETTSYATGYWVDETHPLPLSRGGKRLKMLFFGDLMLDRYVGEKIKKGGLDSILGELSGAGFFYGYDLISANLEGAVTDEGKHYEPIKAYDFAFAPQIIEELKKYNFNFFNIANNHLDDQGMKGATETRKNLDALGLNYSGCVNGEVGECSVCLIRATTDEGSDPLKGSDPEVVIGMVGISAVWDKIDLEKTHDMLEKLKNETELIIVNMHWGDEYEENFNNRKRELARDIIDHGADIIIGHHPHVAQGIEWYNGKPIFYSLGNFIFDQYFSKETQEGLAVEAVLENDKISFKLHPFKSKQSKVELMAGDEREEFLRALSNLSVGDVEFLEQVKNGQILAKFDKD